jgi:hypothetical protein
MPQTLFINVNVFDEKADNLLTGKRALVQSNLIKRSETRPARPAIGISSG